MIFNVNQEYVSETDRFLSNFRKTHVRSVSQRKEIEKYQRIHSLRDRVDEGATVYFSQKTC